MPLQEKQNLTLNDYFIFAAVVLVVVVVVVGAFSSDLAPNENRLVQKVSTATGANVIELNVVDVNPIIARQFRLKSVTGVLINNVPKGTARKLLNLRRGDVVLEYNSIHVQSSNHLFHLMEQNRPGDTITFLISRNGSIFQQSVKIPQSAGMVDLYDPTTMDIFLVVFIIILTFAAIFLDIMHRTICVVLGAVLIMALGSILGFYDQVKAFHAIQLSPIFIFIGMSIFSIVLERANYFRYLTDKLIIKTKGNITNVFFTLCLITYVFSLFVNNLTTIIIIVPITISICRRLKLSPAPVLIAEIISSNIGGASTMVGDFPNMLIASNTGINFIEFLMFMFPIGIVLLASLFAYLFKFGNIYQGNKRKAATLGKDFFDEVKSEVKDIKVNWESVYRAFITLFCVVVAFVVLPLLHVHSATIALGGGFILLALEHKNATAILKKISIVDIIFFIALFIMVGGAVYSGLLSEISKTISFLSGGHKLPYLLILMWTVAFFTMFLNAGPATAFFIPIVIHSQFAAFSDIIWWSLSLGVLAGSSATITGATSGIVAQTILEESLAEDAKVRRSSYLTFTRFSQQGIPIAFMFLVISSLYIALLDLIPAIN